MKRNRKLKLVQLTLLIVGVFVIFFTYFEKERSDREKIISKAEKKTINKKLKQNSNDSNVFYNIIYSGLDLEGNRYTIKSEEAINSTIDTTIVDMKKVHATFYFKDNTTLNVFSNKAIYNNKTLDMIFNKDVRAYYLSTELFAEKAEFSNSGSFLTVSEDVKVNDPRGTVFADKLLFDIKKKTLDIASFNNKKVKTTVKYK
jgi:hypothetical protein